jgi:hypothetical protein
MLYNPSLSHKPYLNLMTYIQNIESYTIKYYQNMKDDLILH